MLFTGWIILKQLEHLLCIPSVGIEREKDPAAPWGSGEHAQDTPPVLDSLVSHSGFQPHPSAEPTRTFMAPAAFGRRSRRLQGQTSAPSPREKIKPSGYRDRKPLICHRKSAHRPRTCPVWAGLNSNSTTGRAGPSYF